jgi:SAM-dependent methyltransferase
MEMPDPVPALPPLPGRASCTVVPDWDLSGLVHRACPVCGSDESAPFCSRPDRLRVARCGRCGMFYVADIPSEAGMARFYQAYASNKGRRPAVCSWLQKKMRWWRDPNLMILERTGGLKGKTLMEIGCSFGAFLQLAAARGAAVHGVDLDQAALDHLGRLGISASESPPAGRTFDVVCGFQVAEHLADPSTWVSRMAAALAPGGRFLLALPNGGECSRVGPGWVGFRVDLEHLNYFSIGTISRLLMDQGLYVEQFWESHQPELPASSLPRPGLLGRLWRKRIAFDARLRNRPFHDDGRFVLTVLGRKDV